MPGSAGNCCRYSAGQSLAPENPRIPATRSIHVALTFVEIAIAELAPHYLRGYGPVSERGAADLQGIVAELQSAVKEMHRYVLQPRAGELRYRVERLASHGWDVAALHTLAGMIERHGLIEFRPTLTMLLGRVEDTALEIAVFGRVSTGKSSLLNHVIGADLLPVGVIPITAVPTRIGYGSRPLVRVWQEGRGISEHNITELGSFVDERLNPENQRRVGRILVLYPSERLREGIIFVDTPGIGSLATSGAAETLAYLPRCDAGTVLVDAGSTLTPDDLKIIGALVYAATDVTVLISKADLLSPQDLEQQMAYVKRQLHTEFGTDLPVRPVSVMASHTALLEQWFAEELAPLYERKQRLLQESLTRKTLALAGAVRSALEVSASYAQIEGEDRQRLEEVDGDLRRSAGHLQEFQSELRRMTEEVPLLAPFLMGASQFGPRIVSTVVGCGFTRPERGSYRFLKSDNESRKDRRIAEISGCWRRRFPWCNRPVRHRSVHRKPLWSSLPLRHVCDQHDGIVPDWIRSRPACPDDGRRILALSDSHWVHWGLHNILDLRV